MVSKKPINKMRVWWFISIIVYLFKPSYTLPYGDPIYPWMERYHYPGYYTAAPSRYVNGTSVQISDPKDTPDYRVEEPFFQVHNQEWPLEVERPYRNSPPYKQSHRSWFKKYWKNMEKMTGCYCCAVYRRLTILSTCAVITSRHILTTATPTLLILRSYSHAKNLEDILGAWYDTDADLFNASLYMTPARIHIHPMYVNEYQVNVSHPIPAMYDLSIWAATYAFMGSWKTDDTVLICPRSSSGWWEYTSSIPRWNDLSIVAGFMFMKAYNRNPLPWIRYILKTRAHVWPCPKSDWHWFHCIQGEYWGRFGFDSGGGMNTAFMNEGWRHDGLAGICAFSMKLRSIQTTHYFTVVDTYPVLDFLYDAFLGLTKPAYLDDRFEDTKWSAPVPWWGESIVINHYFGEQVYKPCNAVPKYRR